MVRNHFIEVKNLVKNYGTGNIKITAAHTSHTEI